MKSDYSYYNYERSIERIDEVLNSSDSNYEDKKSIPSRDNLTFNNGYYVSATALFIDIRDSKSLNDLHTRPVLAKIYKTYISELVAVLKGCEKINEIYIEGDGVWGIFDTPLQADIDSVFSTSAQAASLIDILNVKLVKKGYSKLTVGIGLAYDSALYIKAGYKGSGINEVVWLGSLVGEAAELCSYGSKLYSDGRLMVSSILYSNLNDHNKSLLKWSSTRDCYQGYVINLSMDEWVTKNG